MEGVQAVIATRNLEPDQWRNREEWPLVSGRQQQLLKIPDGWMGGWVGGRMVGWMGGWKNGWMDGWVEEWLDEWVGGRMVGWMGGWKNGWMDGCVDFLWITEVLAENPVVYCI